MFTGIFGSWCDGLYTGYGAYFWETELRYDLLMLSYRERGESKKSKTYRFCNSFLSLLFLIWYRRSWRWLLLNNFAHLRWSSGLPILTISRLTLLRLSQLRYLILFTSKYLPVEFCILNYLLFLTFDTFIWSCSSLLAHGLLHVFELEALIIRYIII